MSATTDYAMTYETDLSYADAIARVREALAEQGFGVLTEIDVAATLKSKLGVEVAPQIILGACSPPLARRSLESEPSIGTLLPCNVVVREGDGVTLVEAVNPEKFAVLSGNETLGPIASEVRAKLEAALGAATEIAA